MQVHLLFEIGSSPNLYTRQESNILLAAELINLHVQSTRRSVSGFQSPVPIG
jgi:hypothetical protein